MVTTRTNLKQQVLQNLSEDEHYLRVKQAMGEDYSDHRYDKYELELDGILRYQGRMYILEGGELRKLILHEVHNTPYLGHPGITKMVADLRSLYFWPKHIKEGIEYVA